MQRIYLPNTVFSEKLSITDKHIHHQITRVLRAKLGDEFIFFDGQTQRDFHYEILDISKREIAFVRSEIREKDTEIFPELYLYQALPNKLDKLEQIVQKCCEIGYKKMIFFLSERSQKLVISENKKERIQKIAVEAIEQCGGNIIPEIEILQPHFSLWKKIEGGLKTEGDSSSLNIFCHTENDNSHNLGEIAEIQTDSINIFVGPEGGFSQDEVDMFENLNFSQVYFGNRILRCETAGIAIGFYLSQK